MEYLFYYKKYKQTYEKYSESCKVIDWKNIKKLHPEEKDFLGIMIEDQPMKNIKNFLGAI